MAPEPNRTRTKAPRTRRGRPSKVEQERRGDIREILLSAAHDAMIAKDSIDVSIHEIADRAGQSPAVVQYHFGGKEGLLHALLKRGTDRAVTQLADLAQMEMSADRKLRYHIRGLIKAYYEAPYVNMLMRHLSEGVPAEEGEAVFREFARPLADFYEVVIAQGVSEGTFRPISPPLFYMMLVGASDYIFARRRMLPALFAIPDMTDTLRQQYAEFLAEIVLTGIRP
ncbi:TetR family transcriptional regulator [Chachezhania sediminis]|uniref:TetR family transcriptional regulator n=1 Tax=Chachezhania sediminis TaxID=2599291 RepID=UPI00131C4665|nr:TetR family transcriptional regulator [Chachezhania sediminis]